MNIKGTLRHTLNRFGYDIVRQKQSVEYPFNLLEVLVEQQLNVDDRFFFMQIGANDGLRTDPLRPLVLKHRLAGLLVEPLPDMFRRLVENYAGQPQLRFENCAIGPQDGEQPLYRVSPDAPVPDWAHGLASFDRRNLSGQRQGIPDLDRYIETVTVPVRTVDAVLRRVGVASVSLLLVDTEGFDYQIVRCAIECGLRPSILVYEHVNLLPATQRTCQLLLKEHGYRFIEVGMDTYALRTESVLRTSIASPKLKRIR